MRYFEKNSLAIRMLINKEKIGHMSLTLDPFS